MKIALIGMMGSGKSAVGRELANLTGYRFIDTDEEIEKAYGKIPEIFASKGEEAFRDFESEMIKALEGTRGAIIATGGGVIKREQNMQYLKNSCKIVYLTADIDVIYDRIHSTDRPLGGGKSKEELQKLFLQRKALYEKYSDFIVTTDKKNPHQTAREIADKLNIKIKQL